MKKLLVNTIPFDITPQMVMESLEQNNGKLLVSGVLQRAEVENQNHRVYPMSVLQRESGKYINGFVKERRALGELDHPNTANVNLQNVSHNISKIWWDGNDLCGEIEVLSTPSGNILRELFKAGIRLGISSRGWGSVKESVGGKLEVQPDFDLIAFDFVSNPSTQGAFMYPMNENVDKKLAEQIDARYGRINSIITDILLNITEK